MAEQRLYSDLSWIWPLLSPPEDYVEEAEKIVDAFRKAGVPAGGTILHLGCGGGSLDLQLRDHFTLTGVDLSERMLEHARRVNPEVEYLTGDMTSVRLDRTFDGVLIHDAQAYLTTPEELQALYETAAAHLAPGGVLVSLPEELRSRFRQHRVNDRTLTDGEVTVTTIEVDFDPDPSDHHFESTFVFVIRDQDGKQRIETDVHRCGLWTIDEVLGHVKAAGFDTHVSAPRLSDMPAGTWVMFTGKKRA